ncbi:UDP-N-acetylmuramate--L-alanine ligase [bacterium A37T11]|nr:UDP-N-acetylmuramate--L-alanine ligase [bacterium A37T11]
MKIDQIKQVFLLGIGGIGMSALARYFGHAGCLVAGYDKTRTTLTDELENEGIEVFYTDDVTQIPNVFKQANEHTLIIYTPAVPKDLAILHLLQKAGHKLYKRSEVLGIISKDRFTIAVAGTHGKTTTSSLIAHILTDSGYQCSAFLGGITVNYNTNVLFSTNNTLVVEADEYDRSFLTLHPNIAIVTSTDADHLDIYGDKEHMLQSFELFLRQVASNGKKIIRKGLQLPYDIRYAAGEIADAYAVNIRVEAGNFYFDYEHGSERLEQIHLGIPGKHNVENAVAAITAARQIGINDAAIVKALATFRGVKRRFEYIIKNTRHIYIDDYAHHPEELRASIGAVKSLYPDKPLTVIFQPHLYSRTRDFAAGFAEVLAMADKLYLMDIYPARELPIKGITSSWLLAQVQLADKHLLTADNIIQQVAIDQPELLLTVGAGDIDRLVQPLKEVLTHD